MIRLCPPREHSIHRTSLHGTSAAVFIVRAYLAMSPPAFMFPSRHVCVQPRIKFDTDQMDTTSRAADHVCNFARPLLLLLLLLLLSSLLLSLLQTQGRDHHNMGVVTPHREAGLRESDSGHDGKRRHSTPSVTGGGEDGSRNRSGVSRSGSRRGRYSLFGARARGALVRALVVLAAFAFTEGEIVLAASQSQLRERRHGPIVALCGAPLLGTIFQFPPTEGQLAKNLIPPER